MPRWVTLLTLTGTVLTAVVVGVLWYLIGGWPQDHDRYGKVEIPGQKTLTLPKGEVRFSFEGTVSGGGQTRTLEDPPEGLEVRVRPRRGRRLKVEEVSSSLDANNVGDRGREPLAKVETPERGRYRIRTVAEGASPGGLVTAGPELWNPLGSRVLGALGIFLASLIVLFLLFELPILFFARSR